MQCRICRCGFEIVTAMKHTVFWYCLGSLLLFPLTKNLFDFYIKRTNFGFVSLLSTG